MDTLLPLVAAVVTILALDAGEMSARAARIRRSPAWGARSFERMRQASAVALPESPDRGMRASPR